MKINKTEIDVSNAIKFANYDNLLLNRRKNGMLLSNYQINILKRNGIDYLNYSNIQALLFDVEEVLNNEYDDELDLVSSQLAEFIYYRDTKK